MRLAESYLGVDFSNGRGELFLGTDSICSISDGRFYSTRLTPNLEPLQEVMPKIVHQEDSRQRLIEIVTCVVSQAVKARHGCTLVISPGDVDINSQVAGQTLEGRSRPFAN